MAISDDKQASDNQFEIDALRERVAHLERVNAGLQTEVDHLKQEVQYKNTHYDEVLRENKERLQFVINQLPGVVWTIDTDYRFTSAQGTGLKVLEIEPQHIIGLTLFELFQHQGEECPPLQAHTCALHGEPATYEHQVRGYTYHVYVEPLRNTDNQIVGAIAVANDITARKRIEEALQESVERFRMVALATRDALYDWNIQNDTVWRNDAFQHLFGAEDAIEPHVSWWKNRIHIADRDIVLRSLDSAIAEGQQTWQSEYRFCRADGTYAVVEDHSYIMHDETGAPVRVIGGMADITERKQSEARQATRLAVTRILAASSGVDTAALKVLHVICWLLDWQVGIMWQTSDTAEALCCTALWCEPDLGATDFVQTISKLSVQQGSGLVGRVWNSGLAEWLNTPADDPHFAQLGDTPQTKNATVFAVPVGSGPNCDRVLCFVNYAGRPNDTILTEMFIDMGQQIQQFIDRKEAEAALIAERASLAKRIAQRTAELSSVNAELARALRVKNEFLAMMSHELRTPLNIILGFAEVLREAVYGSLNDQQQSALNSIYESGHHLLGLITDILDLSRIEAGDVYLQFDTIGIDDICQSSLRFIRHDARSKHIDVHFSLNDTTAVMHADERRLKQMLVNLLSNAVKFTPENGQIGLEVSTDEAKNAISFSVWDTGIGIDQEHISRLFKPFEQLDGSLSKQYEGMGLGLALVARLAEMHSGSVIVESQVGQGSRFTIVLPWQRPAEDTAVDAAEEVAPLTMQRALLIADITPDDEPVIHYLEALGITPSIHRGGTGALEQIQQIQPDVILLDPVLPDFSGWQVLMQIKAEPYSRDIPVIVLSILDEHMRALALGAVNCLTRPVLHHDLRQALVKIEQLTVHIRTAGDTLPVNAADKSPLILLVDDNSATIHLLSEFLLSKGYRVDVACNGADAIQRVRDERPALILMDWQMPGMNGMEATRYIRQDASLASLPIIALTALAMPGDREECLAAGVNEYLSKPVSLAELMQAIEHQLGQVQKW